MKQFMSFVRKEFFHVLRDRKTLFILFGMPVVQILIFGFALTNEVKNSRILIVDQAHDESSKQLIREIEASQYFETENIVADFNQVEKVFKEGKIRVALVIPANFREDLLQNNAASLQLINDASDPNTATTLTNYISSIVLDFQMRNFPGGPKPIQIIPQLRMLYNPQLKGAPNFVPGVMAMVLMLICVMMTAVSIVREKETGTMEVLLVSPFKPLMVIISKAFPYLILSLINVTSILLLSVFVLDLPITGNILLLYAVSTLFIITCLSIGILISVRTDSQQVAMLISLMGMLLPALLFSGFMFPIENMPFPLQIISNIIPAKWYYIMVKAIMIKGLGFSAIWKEASILVAITLVILGISIKNFKIRLA
ncbi:MAG: ABC transporter permease [Bacteroidia bacterium]|nr:ABC transporter permease [Bacteroidia bacterium]MCF8446700.1 ABC transporter permease [Bacteroidia bacterium]